MIRTGRDWRRVSWNEARAFVAERLQALMYQHGPDSIGLLGSARATNEDNFVAQKFARAVIGTNNVDCCARVCHAPSAAALAFDSAEAIWNEVRALCEGARGMSYERLETGGLQWPCPADDHPGTSILHRDAFAIGLRATLQAIRRQPSCSMRSPARIVIRSWAHPSTR